MTWLTCIASNVALASVLALAACFVQRRLHRPSLARWLWVLVLLKLITPPLIDVTLVTLPSTLACTFGVCRCPQHAAQTFIGQSWPWMLFTAWAFGALTSAWIALRRWTQFRRLIAHAKPAPRSWQSLAKALSARLSLQQSPQILVVPGRLPPLVVPGWRRARLLLPAALLDQLSAPQRQSLLMHELVHIRRGDHLIRLLELAVNIAFWWLPGVNCICRQLRACEERCCDAAVVLHLPQARHAYARLLLDVIDFADPLPPCGVPQATAMSSADGVEQRLLAILGVAPQKRRSWPAALLAAGLACAMLPCGLSYDFAGRETPAANRLGDGCEASSVDALRAAALCCPHPN